MTNPPSRLATLTWARPLARVAAGALVLLGLAGVAGGYLFGWSRFDPAGGHHPPVALRVAIAVLGPGLTVLAGWLPARWLGRVAVLGALAAAAFGVLQLITITPQQGYGPGGPLTILGALALAAGWLLGGPPVRAADRATLQLVPALVTFLGTALLAGFAGWGAQHWYTEGRFVDASTGLASTAGAAAGPEGLAHQRWQRTLDAEQLVGLVGRRLVVRDEHGVRALDPATGRERWHYRRSDLATVNAVATADGRSVVVFYGQGRGVLAVALAAATGERRWTEQFNATAGAPWSVGALYPSGHTVGAVEIGGGHGVRLLDVSSPDGHGPEFPKLPAESACTVGAVAVSGDTLAVATRCSDGERVSAVAVRTGRQLWTWQAPYPQGFTSADPMELTGTGKGVLVEYGERGRPTDDGSPVAVAVPRSAVLLDPGSGAPGSAYRVAGSLLVAADGLGVYLDGAAVGIDLTTGSTTWTTPLPAVAGYHPVATAVLGMAAGYLLFRGPTDDGRMNGDGGPLGVVALNLGTGQVTATRILPADPATCRTGTDGRTLCGKRPAMLAIGEAALFVAEQRDGTLALTGLD
jgi:outer membrane protein assembly factor BamB